MAGIYIHIPFCKQACTYCDFHFSTNTSKKEMMVEAILKEIGLRSSFLKSKQINSVYFGGGTPSLLSHKSIASILNKIHKTFSCKQLLEVTLEANPDDLTKSTIEGLINCGVNRLSIGVQSFHNADLKFMNRAHTGMEAVQATQMAQDLGITNISLDLIFGIPGSTLKLWEENVTKFLDLKVPHCSAYALSIEKNTHLHHLIKSNAIKVLGETKTLSQYDLIKARLTESGYQHYEVSNYSKPGKTSLHNSSYWKESHYLGIGPSAHSFNGEERLWNVSNNSIYLKKIMDGRMAFETEELSEKDRYHDLLITSFRTKWGLNIDQLEKNFSPSIVHHFKNKLSHKESAFDSVDEKQIVLKEQHWIIADEFIQSFWLD